MTHEWQIICITLFITNEVLQNFVDSIEVRSRRDIFKEDERVMSTFTPVAVGKL